MKVIQIMPKFKLAGAEKMCEALSLQLKENEDIYVISFYRYESSIIEHFKKNNIKIFYLDKRKGIDLSIIFKLIKIFKEIKPDIVHTHIQGIKYVIPASLLCNIKGKVHTMHNVANEECGKIGKILNKFFFKFCNVTPVSISPIVQKTIYEVYGQNTKTPMIYNGIDLENVIVKNSYERHKDFTFIHVGRYSAQKNHMEMIRAFKLLNEKYSDTKLLLVGVGELFDDVKNLIKELDLEKSVLQLGQCDNVLELYKDADVFLLPSIYEGMPITIIEAMATGMPIIATNVGGVPDMVSHEHSAMLSNPVKEEIFENMEKLYKSDELRGKIAINAKKDSEKFSSKIMSEEYINLYAQILKI